MQHRVVLWFVLGLGACAPSDKDAEDDEAVDPTDSGDAFDMNEVDPDDLNGAQPETALGAPEFSATNRDGSARSREDLLGHPTVMWFYPLAATAG